MAATVIINRWTGASGGPSQADITTINTRANAQDAHEPADVDNPVQKPTSGLKYSFWVSTRLETTVAPAGTINNIKWFSDASNTFGAGITCKGVTATTYQQATGSDGDTGLVLNTSNYTTLTGPPVDVFTHSTGTPKAVSGSTTTNEDFGDWFIYQLEVSTDAGPGASTQETFTWRFDET